MAIIKPTNTSSKHLQEKDMTAHPGKNCQSNFTVSHYHLVRGHLSSNIFHCLLSCRNPSLEKQLSQAIISTSRNSQAQILTSTFSTSALVFLICSVWAFKCMLVSSPTSSILWTSCAPLSQENESETWIGGEC